MKAVGRMPSDAYLMGDVLGLHHPPGIDILDASFGRGRMWTGCVFQPTVRLDRRSLPGVDVVGDWTDLGSLFPDRRFSVIVWDPPHQTGGGVRALGGDWADAYGTAAVELRGKPNISFLYAPFLVQAQQVLEPDGTLLVKLADQVHGGKLHLQAFDFVATARSLGWTVCHLIPLIGWPRPDDPKWRRRFHLRQQWCYWICLHPGTECPSTGQDRYRPCEGCGLPFKAGRRDKRTHGDGCRQRKRRRLAVTVQPDASRTQSVTRKEIRP